MHGLVLAAILSCGALCGPEAKVWYRDLLVEGGYGRMPIERAAFLIREPGGNLTLAPWPRGGHHQASFRGAIPANTIAVLHTHPAGRPDPSAQDRLEAQRTGMPVIVITPSAVIAAEPDGSTRRIE